MSHLPTARLILACLMLTLSLIPARAQDSLDIVFQPAPRPMPTAVMIESGTRLELYFSSLKQGGLGLLRLAGDGIESPRLDFLGRERRFFQVEDDVWYALLIVDMNASPGLRQLTVRADRGFEEISFTRDIRVDSGRFILQEFELPANRAYLVNPAIEAAEFARLEEITSESGPKPLWDADGFGLPLESATTSPFGAFRVLNDGVKTRHTGWDQRASTGTPVHAMASGRVAFAAPLEIRGDAVVIDHGVGVYTLYAHLSATNVTPGQAVDAAQIIGLSGDSGRSTGAHLHWELIVAGHWLDGLEMVALWLPS